MSSKEINFLQLLERNEDLISSCVENVQLGRLEDCMKQYAVLQRNLIALATEVDKYPAGEINDPYEAVEKTFPDQIMRKDLIENYLPMGPKPMPQPPITPSCNACSRNKIPAYQCRVYHKHIEPSAKFSSSERNDFLRVAQVLAIRHANFGGIKGGSMMNGPTCTTSSCEHDRVGECFIKSDSSSNCTDIAGYAPSPSSSSSSFAPVHAGNALQASGTSAAGFLQKLHLQHKLIGNSETAAPGSAAVGVRTTGAGGGVVTTANSMILTKNRKAYKRWNEHERYSLDLAISLFGIKNKSTPLLSQLLGNRSEVQIRSFISKNILRNLRSGSDGLRDGEEYSADEEEGAPRGEGGTDSYQHQHPRSVEQSSDGTRESQPFHSSDNNNNNISNNNNHNNHNQNNTTTSSSASSSSKAVAARNSLTSFSQLQSLLSSPPKGYQPPARLAYLFTQRAEDLWQSDRAELEKLLLAAPSDQPHRLLARYGSVLISTEASGAPAVCGTTNGSEAAAGASGMSVGYVDASSRQQGAQLSNPYLPETPLSAFSPFLDRPDWNVLVSIAAGVDPRKEHRSILSPLCAAAAMTFPALAVPAAVVPAVVAPAPAPALKPNTKNLTSEVTNAKRAQKRKPSVLTPTTSDSLSAPPISTGLTGITFAATVSAIGSALWAASGTTNTAPKKQKTSRKKSTKVDKSDDAAVLNDSNSLTGKMTKHASAVVGGSLLNRQAGYSVASAGVSAAAGVGPVELTTGASGGAVHQCVSPSANPLYFGVNTQHWGNCASIATHSMHLTPAGVQGVAVGGLGVQNMSGNLSVASQKDSKSTRNSTKGKKSAVALPADNIPATVPTLYLSAPALGAGDHGQQNQSAGGMMLLGTADVSSNLCLDDTLGGDDRSHISGETGVCLHTNALQSSEQRQQQQQKQPQPQILHSQGIARKSTPMAQQKVSEEEMQALQRQVMLQQQHHHYRHERQQQQQQYTNEYTEMMLMTNSRVEDDSLWDAVTSFSEYGLLGGATTEGRRAEISVGNKQLTANTNAQIGQRDFRTGGEGGAYPGVDVDKGCGGASSGINAAQRALQPPSAAQQQYLQNQQLQQQLQQRQQQQQQQQRQLYHHARALAQLPSHQSRKQQCSKQEQIVTAHDTAVAPAMHPAAQGTFALPFSRHHDIRAPFSTDADVLNCGHPSEAGLKGASSVASAGVAAGGLRAGADAGAGTSTDTITRLDSGLVDERKKSVSGKEIKKNIGKEVNGVSSSRSLFSAAVLSQHSKQDKLASHVSAARNISSSTRLDGGAPQSSPPLRKSYLHHHYRQQQQPPPPLPQTANQQQLDHSSDRTMCGLPPMAAVGSPTDTQRSEGVSGNDRGGRQGVRGEGERVVGTEGAGRASLFTLLGAVSDDGSKNAASSFSTLHSTSMPIQIAQTAPTTRTVEEGGISVGGVVNDSIPQQGGSCTISMTQPQQQQQPLQHLLHEVQNGSHSNRIGEIEGMSGEPGDVFLINELSNSDSFM